MEKGNTGGAMAGIDDVAGMAAVSIATVSRVFNRPDSVKPSTRERVLNAAQALNYQPNASARNLRGIQSIHKKGLTHTVGFLADRKTVMHGDPFAYELLEAVESALCERGLGIRIIPVSPDGNIPREIAEHGVDGVISRLSAPMVRRIAEQVHTVSLDEFDLGIGGYAVVPDYTAGLRTVMDRLFAARLTDVALLSNDPAKVPSENFWELFPKTCAEAYERRGLPIPAGLHRGAAYDHKSGYETGCRIFADKKAWPDAIIGPDGAMLGLYRAAAEHGARIPDDVSVIGVNGLRFGEFLHPALTTIDVRPARMGAIAVEILADCIASGTRRRGVEIVPVVLRERASARIKAMENKERMNREGR